MHSNGELSPQEAMYIQYRMMCIFLLRGPYQMQLWIWIDQSYQLNQSLK